jgi:alpha-L-fucosidase 2
MLLQSAHGYINILPALPAVWNRTGKVTGMKAMGNFTVDFEWNSGKCQNVSIVSNAGAELRVRCDLGAMALNKASIKVNGVEIAATIDENNIATIPCEKDDVVEIDFTTETGIAPIFSADKKAEIANAPIYDLYGRRITKMNEGQVYIQNGVKMIAK